MDREIPIILDDLADPEFGTGVVKVTPAHDPNDFEAGRRHNLPKIQVIDDRGMMTAAAGPYAGLDRFEARRRVRRRPGSPRRPGQDRALRAQPRHLPALQDGRRAARLHAVVRED